MVQAPSCRIGPSLLAATVLALAGCAPAGDEPVATPPRLLAVPAAAPARVLVTDDPLLLMPDLMALVLDPAAGVLQAGAGRDPERQPSRPEAWQAVGDAAFALERSTAQLGEPGWSLGRADWLRAVAALRDGSRAGAEAARAQDLPRLARAGAQVRAACDACHALYAPDLR